MRLGIINMLGLGICLFSVPAHANPLTIGGVSGKDGGDLFKIINRAITTMPIKDGFIGGIKEEIPLDESTHHIVTFSSQAIEVTNWLRHTSAVISGTKFSGVGVSCKTKDGAKDGACSEKENLSINFEFGQGANKEAVLAKGQSFVDACSKSALLFSSDPMHYRLVMDLIGFVPTANKENGEKSFHFRISDAGFQVQCSVQFSSEKQPDPGQPAP